MSGKQVKAALYRCGSSRQCNWYAIIEGNILMWWNWKVEQWQGSVYPRLNDAAAMLGVNHQPQFIANVRIKL